MYGIFHRHLPYPKDPITFSDDDWGVLSLPQEGNLGSITILRRWARIPRDRNQPTVGTPSEN